MIFCPKTFNSPELSFSNPKIALSKVVFPEPLGPMIPVSYTHLTLPTTPY